MTIHLPPGQSYNEILHAYRSDGDEHRRRAQRSRVVSLFRGTQSLHMCLLNGTHTGMQTSSTHIPHQHAHRRTSLTHTYLTAHRRTSSRLTKGRSTGSLCTSRQTGMRRQSRWLSQCLVHRVSCSCSVHRANAHSMCANGMCARRREGCANAVCVFVAGSRPCQDRKAAASTA